MNDENWVRNDKWWNNNKKIQTAPKIFSREMPFRVLQPLKVVVYKMSEDLI